MNKKKMRKLTISRETVRHLKDEALQDVAAAATGPANTWCDVCTEATRYCTLCACP